MNKRFAIIIPTLAMLLSGCAGGKTVPVESISISETEVSVPVGQKYKVDAIITPNDATNKSFSWDSENYDVCYVLGGSITGVSVGETYITATTVDGGKTAKCLVHVTEKEPEVVHVTGVVVDKPSITMEVGQSETITATVVPSNADNKKVSWSVISNPENAISVNNGVVTANEVGNAVVTVTTEDGEFTAMTTVTVKGEEKKKVTGVLLDKESIKVAISDTSTLKATVLPTDATDKEVSWSVEDPSIATVKDGVVTGVAIGNTTVTVTTHDGGFTKTCAVEVTKAPVEQGVTMNVNSGGVETSYKLEKSSTGVEEYYISHVFKKDDTFSFVTNDGQTLNANDIKTGSSIRFNKDSKNNIVALTAISTEIYVELSEESSEGKGIYLAENHEIKVKRSSDTTFEKTLEYDSEHDSYYFNGIKAVPGETFEFLVKDGTKLTFTTTENTNYDLTKGVLAGSSDATINIGLLWDAANATFQIFVTGLETNRQVAINRNGQNIYYVLVKNEKASKEEYMTINIRFEAGDCINAAYALGEPYSFNLAGGTASTNFEKQADGSYKVKSSGSFNCYLTYSSETQFDQMYIDNYA